MGRELAYHVGGLEFGHQHPINWVVAHRTLIPTLQKQQQRDLQFKVLFGLR